MKNAAIILIATASLQALSATIASGPLPQCEFADTETEANCPFSTARPGSRVLSFQISLIASPSNNVEVAIGRDANNDGELSIDETDMIVGWDCSEWTVRSGAGEGFLQADTVTGSTHKTLVWELYETDGRARAIKATENGHQLDFGTAGSTPSWMFNSSWNLVRLVARGADCAGESFIAKLSANGTAISLR